MGDNPSKLLHYRGCCRAMAASSGDMFFVITRCPDLRTASNNIKVAAHGLLMPRIQLHEALGCTTRHQSLRTLPMKHYAGLAAHRCLPPAPATLCHSMVAMRCDRDCAIVKLFASSAEAYHSCWSGMPGRGTGHLQQGGARPAPLAGSSAPM